MLPFLTSHFPTSFSNEKQQQEVPAAPSREAGWNLCRLPKATQPGFSAMHSGELNSQSLALQSSTWPSELSSQLLLLLKFKRRCTCGGWEKQGVASNSPEDSSWFFSDCVPKGDSSLGKPGLNLHPALLVSFAKGWLPWVHCYTRTPYATQGLYYKNKREAWKYEIVMIKAFKIPSSREIQGLNRGVWK